MQTYGEFSGDLRFTFGCCSMIIYIYICESTYTDNKYIYIDIDIDIDRQITLYSFKQI